MTRVISAPIAEGDLDPLAQGHRGHPATSAATAQAEVGGIILHRDKIGPTAMCGNARVDLVSEDLDDPLGNVPAQVRPGAGHGRAGPAGPVDGWGSG